MPGNASAGTLFNRRHGSHDLELREQEHLRRHHHDGEKQSKQDVPSRELHPGKA